MACKTTHLSLSDVPVSYFSRIESLPSLGQAPHLLLIGAGIMLLSCGITSYANILMKLDAVLLRSDPNPKFIMARKFVVTAVSLYLIGGLADTVALALVPLSLRACASVLTIPFNAVMAKVFLNESMMPVQILGAGVTVVSAIVAMLFASQQTGGEDGYTEKELPILRMTAQIEGVPFESTSGPLDVLLCGRVFWFVAWTVPVFLFCVRVVVVQLRKKPTYESPMEITDNVGGILPPSRYSSSQHRLFVLSCTTVAVSYQTAWTNLLIKVLAMIGKESGIFTLSFWAVLLLIISSALCQMMLMSAMMQLFDAVIVIPPYQILITVWLVIFSSVVFSEFPANVFGFTLSLLVAFGGIALVALAPSGGYVTITTTSEIEIINDNQTDSLVTP